MMDIFKFYTFRERKVSAAYHSFENVSVICLLKFDFSEHKARFTLY